MPLTLDDAIAWRSASSTSQSFARSYLDIRRDRDGTNSEFLSSILEEALAIAESIASDSDSYRPSSENRSQ